MINVYFDYRKQKILLLCELLNNSLKKTITKCIDLLSQDNISLIQSQKRKNQDTSNGIKSDERPTNSVLSIRDSISLEK